jgi:hypothetical protein
MNGLDSSMCPFLTYPTDNMRSANLLLHKNCSNHMSMARGWWRLQWAMVRIFSTVALGASCEKILENFFYYASRAKNCTVNFLTLVAIPMTNLNVATLVKSSCLLLAGEAFLASLEQAGVVVEAKPSVAKLAHLLTSLMAVTGRPPGTLILLLRYAAYIYTFANFKQWQIMLGWRAEDCTHV